MPRIPRLDVPGVPRHVVQRGNCRQPCFFAQRDYDLYRGELREQARRFGCEVHAYVLMTNHVHLLVTPAEAGAVSRLMQALGRRFVRAINDRYARTGTLWDGRFKACLVDSDRYVLECYRYIELNPVRADLVAHPGEYPWSSHRCNAAGEADPLVTPHPCFLALGTEPTERRKRYGEFVAAAAERDVLQRIRRYTNCQRALGSDAFQDAVEIATGRRARPARTGRPEGSKDVRPRGRAATTAT